MLKIILLLLLTFCFSAESYAQTNLKDSLLTLLKKEKQDTTRALLLAELSRAYGVSSKPDSAMILAQEGLQLSRRIGFLKGEAMNLHRLSGPYGNSFGNDAKALELLLQSLKINEKINNVDGIARNVNNIAGIYARMGDHRQALNYYIKAKIFAEQTNDKAALSLYLSNIAETYGNLRILDSALSFTQQAYDLAVKINHPRVIGRTLSQMGYAYSATGQNTLALEFHRLSVPQHKKGGNRSSLSYAFLAIARVFKYTSQIDSSLFYARRAMAIAKEGGGLVEDSFSNFLYSIYKDQGVLDSALFYLEMAKTTNDSLSSKESRQALQSLAFDERLRQQELATMELKAKEERKHNLQFAAIAIGLITFIILFFVLSRSIIVKTKFIEFFGVLLLLAVFEFINLFIHPYLAHATNDSPVLMLLALIIIGALLIPLHHKLEKWMTHVMVEKNKKIRLDAARKTIANLEAEQPN